MRVRAFMAYAAIPYAAVRATSFYRAGADFAMLVRRDAA